MTPEELAKKLSIHIDPGLAKSLLHESTELESAFTVKKWKYTELDGGRFAEVASRIVYAVDSSNVSLSKGVDDCLRYVDNEQVTHHFPDRQAAIHLAKVLRAIYKLRSQRGAVHVSATYSANEIDSRLIVEMTRWVLAEILRLFVTTDREDVANMVRNLARFPHPIVRMYGEVALLQSTSFTTEEEVLAHLLFADAGLSLQELIRVIPKDQSGVRRAVAKLAASSSRQIVTRDGKLLITDLGISRIEDKIANEAA
jgi:hypothetical protein